MSDGDIMKNKNNFAVVRKHKQGVVLVNTETGEKRTLLNPSGRGQKYAKELKTGIAYTNDGSVKTDNKGISKTLNKVQRSFRAGYLQARKDIAKAYKAKNSK